MRRPPTQLPFVAAVAAVLVTVVAALGGRRAGAQPVAALREHRWVHRVLVVAPAPRGSAAESTYRAQQAEVARAAAAFAERDLVVVDLGTGTDPGRAATVRRQLGLSATGFGVVLVGKDGGVKLRRRSVLPAAVVLATIDAMPMGAAEARRRRTP
jgi:hypothetical protein